jgi:hypothetical protein
MVFMLQNTRIRSGFLIASALFVISTVLSGCTSTKERELLRRNELLQQNNSELVTQLAERDAVMVSMQMELVERQAEIDRIKSSQEDLTQEVEQNKIRRPAPGSKVEAVTYLAEVATDIDAAREDATASEQEVFARADRFIAESKTELERGDFDKVRSLASQAMELIQDLRRKTALDKTAKETASSDFIAPLQLRLAKRSNIRMRPGTQEKILVTMAAKTTVAATGYQGTWIKVTLNDGRIGWIHYSLLVVPATNLPFPNPVQ